MDLQAFRSRLGRRALFTCCHLGLWGTAHADGTIVLRLLPTGARNERQTIRMEPNAPLLALNVPEFRAPFLVGFRAQARVQWS